MTTIADSNMDRRSLLKALSASPLVFGMPSLWADDPQDKQDRRDKQDRKHPSWYRDALAQAKKYGQPVVAFVVPPKKGKEPQTPALKRQKAEFKKRLGELCGNMQFKGMRGGGSEGAFFVVPFQDRQSRLAVYLQLLLQSKSVAVQELLLEATYLCAPAGLLGAEKSETVVILDPNGRRVGGAMVDLSQQSVVVEKLQHLLRGHGKLQKRARAARADALDQALARLQRDNRNDKLRKEARNYLIENIRAVIPILVLMRKTHKDPVFKRELTDVVRIACKNAAKRDYQGVLPFGARIDRRQIYDPCPPCGMAVTPAGTRKMLKFLSK